MLFTKEKLVLLVAVLLAIFATWRSLNTYQLPGELATPAEEERAQPFRPGGDLLPPLKTGASWSGAGRNPFVARDLYADHAPVPLNMPPAAPAENFAPPTGLGRGFLAHRVLVEEPAPVAPELGKPDPLSGAAGPVPGSPGVPDKDKKEGQDG